MSIPSLRQQMINEALDYHMNMNHIVFNRERKHIEMAGQQTLDKKQSDIIIEGNIRDRISRIMTAIQKLIQTTQYTEGETTAATSSNVSRPVEMGLTTSMATQTESDYIQSGLDKTTIPGSSLRSKKYISDSIATILSEYNGLCDYIDLQGRQKAFSQSDIAGIDGLVKQLIDSLKSVLVPVMAIKKSRSPESYAEYTRIYNVITAMIKNIQIGFPFQKVESQMLTERVPLREDIITRSDFDPYETGTRQYMEQLYNSLIKEKASLENKLGKATKSPLEREAIQTRITAVDQQIAKLRTAGYRPIVERRAITETATETATEQVRARAEARAQELMNMAEAKAEEDALAGRRTLLDVIYSVLIRNFGVDEANNIFGNLFNGLRDEEAIDAYNELRDRTRKDVRLPSLAALGITGRGKPIRKKGKEASRSGGHVHKQEVFDDQAELEPYLTKHLRPSKYRKDVPPIESSSEESSGEEGDGSDMEINELRLGKGRKKKATRKQKEDIKVIMKLPTKEAAVLIEKKRGGAKKNLTPINKPAISDSKADKDLWFM